jgi:hypothetical protein
MPLSTVVNFGSAITAFIAGALWWKASRVRVPMQPNTNPSGIAIGLPNGSMDIIATVQKSACLNARAAAAAAVAAALQGIGLLLAFFNL